MSVAMLRKILPILASVALAAALPSHAQEKERTVRPEVGKPIQAAIDLLKHRRAREALAKAREAQAVGNKTAYEALVVEQVLGQAAASAGEATTAARAFESAAGSSAASEQHRRQFLAAAASQYYVAKNYAKAAELSGRYLRAGGSDRGVRVMHAQALYLGHDYAAAARALEADIEDEVHAGRKPAEEQLELLLSAYHQQHDAHSYSRAMEKLITYYPKKEYWINALQGVAANPTFSDRLAIDLARLKLATGSMRTANEYVEAAQLSLQEGFPMEAVRTIQQGYAAGVLGKGPEAERHKRLKDLAEKTLAEDRRSIAQENTDAAKDGKTLFNDGYDFVLNGKNDAGLEMMEKGLKLGTGFRRPEHAKLQLAHAYDLAGKKRKAIQIYKSVRGNDGSQAIARLWIIHLNQKGSE